MKLAPLLYSATVEDLQRLSVEHIRSDEELSRSSTCTRLESTLRSFRLVQDVLFVRQPPAFGILTMLLEAPDLTLPRGALVAGAATETERLCEQVSSGEVLGRDDQLRLYRRVLVEARRSDLQIDDSEAALLGVLRRELNIAHVEHFLIEHHTDLQEFWRREEYLERELTALQSLGLVFERDAHVLVASDMTSAIQQALGVEMPRSSARRLFGSLSGADLADALSSIGARTSGSKEERVERLLSNWVQPTTVLKTFGLPILREMCRALGLSASGAKEELAARIVEGFAAGNDQPVEEAAPEPVTIEARALDEVRWRALFQSLTGAELGAILSSFDELKQSGSKETRVGTLFESRWCEATLLSCLTGPDLENILWRARLRLGGSKAERIARLVDHWGNALLTGATGAASGDGNIADG